MGRLRHEPVGSRGASHHLVVHAPLRFPHVPRLPADLEALAHHHGAVQRLLPPAHAHGRPPAHPQPGGARGLRRGQGRGLLLEADHGHLHLHRMRPLRDQLPRLHQRQGSLAQEDHARYPEGGGAAGTCSHQSAQEQRRDGTPQAHRRRWLRRHLGLRELRRVPGAVPGLHRARPGADRYAALPRDGRGEDAGDRRRRAPAARAARPSLAGRRLHPHLLVRGDGVRDPEVRRQPRVPLLGGLHRRAGGAEHQGDAGRRPAAARSRR